MYLLTELNEQERGMWGKGGRGARVGEGGLSPIFLPISR